MELHNSFTVPAAIDTAWETLMDIERVAPCLPGATLESYDGDVITGKVKVKVGPVQMTYAGKGTFLSRDPVAHTTEIEAAGRESRGSGTASAKVTASLHSEGPETTRVEVVTDLTITGKAAQFGRGVLQDVAARIVGQFADNLAVLMTAEPAAADEPAPDGAAADATPAPPAALPQLPHHDDAIDLLDTAGAPVLKRVAPLLAALTVVGLVWWLLSRRRGR